jgi:hypothetical protein
MTRNILKNKTAISTAIIALVVIVIAAAAAGGAYYVLTQNNPSSPATSESPTPSTSPSATSTATLNPSASTSPTVAPSSTETTEPSPSASPTGAPTVVGATSLKYSVSLTEAGVVQGTYTYQGKNAGTSSFMMRIDSTDSSNVQSTIIINGAEQKAWTYSDAQWTDISAAYTTYYNIWNPLWQGYVTSLSAWSGIGDYSYTQGNATVRIYEISVNPVLADSLFQHS